MLLHSIVPHQHANELDDFAKNEVFSEAKGVVDYIKLMFLTDLGEGHMESFNQGEDIDFKVDINFEQTTTNTIFSNSYSLQSIDTNNFVFSTKHKDEIPIINRYFLSNIDFRGPPILS